MRSTRLLVTSALSAALLVSTGALGAVAGGDFTATLSLRAYTNVRDVALKAGKQNVPAGKTVNAWFFKETGTPDPGPFATGWKVAPTTYKLPDADGAHTVYVWARATGQVVSESGFDTTFLDRVKPVIDEVVTIPAQDTPAPTITSRTVTLEIEASDPGDPTTGSGIGKYAVVNGIKAPANGTAAWKNAPIPATVNHLVTKTNGDKTVSVFVRDRAGNVSLATTVSFKLELTGPTVSLNMPATTKVAEAPITTLSAVSGSGTAGYFIKVTGTNNQPDAPAFNATGWRIKPTKVTLASQGDWFVWAWAKDNNNSVSTSPAMDGIYYDATKPTASFEITSADPSASRTVNVSGSGLDNTGGSGVTKYALVAGTPASVTNAANWKDDMPATFLLPKGNGPKTMSMFVKDLAGNVSNPVTDTITLAIPAPSMLTFNIVPVNSSSLTVDISKTQSDPGDTGYGGYYISQSNTQPEFNSTGWSIAPGNFTFPAAESDGMKTLYIWVKDNNNSVSAASLSDTVRLDRTKPLAVLTAVGTTLTISGTDGGSGVVGYMVKVTTGATPAIPAVPAANDAAWKATTTEAVNAVSPAVGNRATLFVKDAAGNVSVVDTNADPHVNSRILS